MVHQGLLEVGRVLRELGALGQELRPGLLASVLEYKVVARFVVQVVPEFEGLVAGLDQLYRLAGTLYSSS